jgi:hypothetical protein
MGIGGLPNKAVPMKQPSKRKLPMQVPKQVPKRIPNRSVPLNPNRIVPTRRMPKFRRGKYT